MNFLAHIYLSGGDEETMLGNFFADFTPMRDEGLYSEGVRRGFRLHRKIDAYADGHPAFNRSRKRVMERQGKFAGILVDICYDHFLARKWDAYSGELLEVFTRNFYRVLKKRHKELPEKAREIVPRLAGENWLLLYREEDGIAAVLKRLALRIGRGNNLASGDRDLAGNYAGLEADFDEFFPRLKEYVEGLGT